MKECAKQEVPPLEILSAHRKFPAVNKKYN